MEFLKLKQLLLIDFTIGMYPSDTHQNESSPIQHPHISNSQVNNSYKQLNSIIGVKFSGCS